MIEVNVRHHRDTGSGANFLEGLGRLHAGHGDPDQIGTRRGDGMDLCDRCLDVAGFSVGHALHGDRGIAANRHVPHLNLSTYAALYGRRLVHGHCPPASGSQTEYSLSTLTLHPDPVLGRIRVQIAQCQLITTQCIPVTYLIGDFQAE